LERRKVPKGRLTLAQDAVLGRNGEEKSPEGTAEKVIVSDVSLDSRKVVEFSIAEYFENESLGCM
jgi:hypothetical protein